jgi:hypothetical protein
MSLSRGECSEMTLVVLFSSILLFELRIRLNLIVIACARCFKINSEKKKYRCF